jgi:hypothetical protein
MEVITRMVSEQAEFGHNFDLSKEDKFIHNINEIPYLLNLISKSNFFTKSVFDSVVAGAFQITFRAKMHVNNIFFLKKIIFDISTSKRSKTYKLY